MTDLAPGLIRDADAARIVTAAVNAMRDARDDPARLLAVRDCSRKLDPVTHFDAVDHVTIVALDMYDLPADEVQGALAEGQRLRSRDFAAEAAPISTAVDEGALAAKVASEWEGKEPRALRWTVRKRIPRGAVAILSGDGAIGKTTISLQLAVAVARGSDWLGAPVEEGGPVLFFSAEEEENEIHRRLAMIVSHHGIKFSDLPNLHVYCRPGENALLGTISKGVIAPTPLLTQLTLGACERRASLIIIEAMADVFAGDEINRGHVSQFMALMRQLALKTDAAVLLLQHPSLAGMSTGTGTAGSTHWNNAARSRLYFSSVKAGDEPDTGLRELRVMKSNYGPAAESVKVRWQRGVFVPSETASIERAATEPIDDAFLRCLDAATAQGRTVSDNTGKNYAPPIFEQMPQAKGIKRGAFKPAMARLFSANRIRISTTGPASKLRSQIVRATPHEHD
jgi:RecA-family ATPase